MKNILPENQIGKHSHRVFLYAGTDVGEKEAFSRCHLPNSYFLSLKEDMIGAHTPGSGRHPLPDMHAFAERMMDLGISPDTPVLIYGDGVNMCAFRLWWMLKAVGVQDVMILYDSEKKWESQCTDTPTPAPVQKGQDLSFDSRFIVDMPRIRTFTKNKEATLIDSRDAERYRGIKDEMDHKPGHIPHALSYPYEDLLGESAPTKEQIRAHFRALPKDKPVAVYCGSGVSAPWNILLLDEIGIDAALYPGSFSGWIEDKDNPVV